MLHYFGVVSKLLQGKTSLQNYTTIKLKPNNLEQYSYFFTQVIFVFNSRTYNIFYVTTNLDHYISTIYYISKV